MLHLLRESAPVIIVDGRTPAVIAALICKTYLDPEVEAR